MTNTVGYSEYLTLYFKNNPELFHLNEVIPPEYYRLPQYRLNLDYPEDYEVLKNIFEGLKIKREPLSLSSVIEYLKKYPEVAAINKTIKPKYQDGEFAEFIDKITTIKANNSKSPNSNDR